MNDSQGAVGVLVKDEIENEIAQGRLVRNVKEGKVRGCSFDLTVGTIFWEGKIIGLSADKQPEQVTVPPGGVIGIFTAEELNLPEDICATAFAINALSSKGFLVLNPGHVDPGFDGALTVKALNVRKTPIVIHQGDPIFTVIFQRIGKAAPLFSGNKSRRDREREFNATTVETSPRAIADVIEADEHGPFLGRSQVEKLIREHWMSRLALWLPAFALVLSLIAAIASVFQLHWGAAQDDAPSRHEAPSAGVKPASVECIPPWLSKPVPSADAPVAPQRAP